MLRPWWLQWEMQAASRKRAIWVPGSDWSLNSTAPAANPGCLEYQNVATLIYALCSFMELAQRYSPFQELTRLWGNG